MDGFVSLLVAVVVVPVTSRFRFPLLALRVSSAESESDEDGVARWLSEELLSSLSSFPLSGAYENACIARRADVRTAGDKTLAARDILGVGILHV